MHFKDILRSHWVLILIFLLGVSLRIYAASGNSVAFWYDQARDAKMSRDILENGDLKIQGPSASGTNDTVYHGVIYYYLIAPLYTLFKGNPQIVAYALGILASTSILLGYFVAVKIFKSEKVGLVTAFLLAVSFFNIQASIWLSNPQLLLLSVPLFYYFLWKVSQKKKKLLDFLLLGISFGLCLQIAVYEVFLGITVIAWYGLLAWKEQKIIIFNIKEITVFVVSTLLTISTMLLTEALMIHRGILQLSTLQTMERNSTGMLDNLVRALTFYKEITTEMLFPQYSVIISLLLVIPLFFGLKKMIPHIHWWTILFFFGPLWLLTFQFRDSPHTFIGIESILYLSLAVGFITIKEKFSFGTIVMTAFLIAFAYSNISTLVEFKNQRKHLLVIQEGALLSEQLQLIDTTYEQAQGSPFSISTLTAPYGISITWSYLYDWYGKSKYGYTPTFVGMPQVGYISEDVLSESTTAEETHFTILEPDTLVGDTLLNTFLSDQDAKAGSVSAEYSYGSVKLQAR